jgi:ABC-type sugar transport system permease subunit
VSQRTGLDRPITVWLLLGPTVLYLLTFAIYPLFYSLRLSLTDLTAATGTGQFIGFRNYRDLFVDPLFWNATWNSAVMVVSSVTLQVLLGVALAMFFNLHLRGSWIVRGILVLPMLITPIVVGVMWRALLNPDWGLVNWAISELGFEQPNWLGSIEMAMKTLIIVDTWQWTPFVFIIVFRAASDLAAGCVRGGTGRRRRPVDHLLACNATAADAGHCVRRRLPRRRRVSFFRSDLRPQLWRPGAQHDDACLLLVPERVPVPELRLRRRRRLHDAGYSGGRDDGVTSLRPAQAGAHEMRNPVGRFFAYVVLVCLGIVGIAPFIYLAILSGKRRIEILSQVPPTLSFEWATIVRTYSEVLFSQGMLSFTVNSIVVVSAATLISVIIGTPAAYAFSRLHFRGSENLANTILSMRFMPPIAIAIPLFLMIRAVGLDNSYIGLILPYVAFSLPLVVWILIGFFDEIPARNRRRGAGRRLQPLRRALADHAADRTTRPRHLRPVRRDLHLE